jgi:SAM-dependent methyltransferase
MSYLKTFYDLETKPITAYPQLLTKHLFDIFSLRTGMSLLEPGVGRGEHLKLFKKLGLSVEGFDVTNDAIVFSPDLNIKILDSDYGKWPYDDCTFDVVYSKSFIEHLADPSKYVRESFRVLKPGGLLLTLTPDWEVNYKTFFDDYTHVKPFTKMSLRRIQLSEGFDNVNVFKLRQLPIVWKYPILNLFCAIMAPFIPVRTEQKFFRWSRELMLVGSGTKPNES